MNFISLLFIMSFILHVYLLFQYDVLETLWVQTCGKICIYWYISWSATS